MTTCTKAIIPVAGFGTRRLPITKSVEKCMLPVGNRPIVDYVVEDCIKAGVRDIYFVVSSESTQLESFYTRNEALESYLRANGKEAMIPSITPPQDITFHYIAQPADGRYGTAIPVALAREHIPAGESVLVLMGDDFLYRADGGSDIADMVAASSGDALLGVEIPRQDVSRYGVIHVEDGYFRDIVEKPTPSEAPSNLINVSKYLMSSGLLDEVVTYVGNPEHNEPEYYITTPINTYVAKGGQIAVQPNTGRYCDGGTLEGWLAANEVVAKNTN